jgi:hypothetical protein
MNATYEASRARKERFETIQQLRRLYQAMATKATQNGLGLKKEQRQPTPMPPTSRKSHQQQCVAMEFPDIVGRVLSPLSLGNTSVPLKRLKRAGSIQHPGLAPATYGHGSMMMVPPKRTLSPTRTDYRKIDHVKGPECSARLETPPTPDPILRSHLFTL